MRAGVERASRGARQHGGQPARSRRCASGSPAPAGQSPPQDETACEGYSGSTLLRPALERLHDAVAAGVIDEVHVLAPDRLARRYAYQVLLVEEFGRAGAEQDLLLQVQGMIAECERARILERSRRGRRHAARSGVGQRGSGKPPFGYRCIAKDAGGGVARVEVAAEEARLGCA